MNTTLEYYERNAQTFINDTLKKEMDQQYALFERYLSKDAVILDAGCGSGRDSLYFKKQGYRVSAFDASKKMCDFATDLLGQDVLHLDFESIRFNDEFDAVWASASLLHIKKEKMRSVLLKLSHALKPDGTLYASFKYGDDEFIKGERYFNRYTEKSFCELLHNTPFKCQQAVILKDTRPERENEYWLNVICRNAKTN